MNKTIVRLGDFPPCIHSFVFHDDDGNNIIVVNSRLSADQQREAFEHEIRHIRNGDMYDKDYHEYGSESPC